MSRLPVLELPVGEGLVVSESAAARELLAASFQHRGRILHQASGGAEAVTRMGDRPWQYLLLEDQLPDLNALELRDMMRRRFSRLPVLLLHRQKNAPSRRGVRTTCAGVRAINEVRDLCPATRPAISRLGLAERSAVEPLPEMVGTSETMQKVYRMARLIAPRNTTVLITGATGTGKELVARAIHRLSPRASRSFSVVNCAAIPEALLEAELFGYVRGAFTGAVQSQTGRVQAAQGGTLFLDEVGELPFSLQAKLLRFLEQKEIQRLGSAEVVRVDVRVLAASNADLERRVANREFREDLFYRLACFPLSLPCLADRVADILPLARHFLSRFGGPPLKLSDEAARLLQSHPWPGNVRELQYVMERACIVAETSPEILPEHISFAGFCERSRLLQQRAMRL